MSQPSPSQNPLRIGILGCANIAKQFTRDVAGSPTVQVAAVASRDAGNAAAFAAASGIEWHHGSYEALLADPALDAVYRPCRTACMPSGPSARRSTASTCCARSRWP